MENSNNNKEEKCPFHNQHDSGEKRKDQKEMDANTGDWDDQREDARTDEEGYDTDKNDNTGGAGSSGSAATNS